MKTIATFPPEKLEETIKVNVLYSPTTAAFDCVVCEGTCVLSHPETSLRCVCGALYLVDWQAGTISREWNPSNGLRKEIGK